MLAVVFVLIFIWILIAAFVGEEDSGELALRITLIVIFLFIFTQTWCPFFERNYRLCILALITIGLIVKILAELILDTDGTMSTAVTPLVTFVVFNVSTFYVLILNVVHLIIFFIRWYIYIINTSHEEGSEIGTMLTANTII